MKIKGIKKRLGISTEESDNIPGSGLYDVIFFLWRNMEVWQI